jgi:single-strand DNA-binding protein
MQQRSIAALLNGACLERAWMQRPPDRCLATRLRVGVGKDEDVQWLSVAVFGKAAEAAAQLHKGDRIYVEGTLKLDSWRGQDGTERHGLSVASFKLEKTHQIGRNRPKREREHEHDDSPQHLDPNPPPYDSIPY